MWMIYRSLRFKNVWLFCCWSMSSFDRLSTSSRSKTKTETQQQRDNNSLVPFEAGLHHVSLKKRLVFHVPMIVRLLSLCLVGIEKLSLSWAPSWKQREHQGNVEITTAQLCTNERTNMFALCQGFSTYAFRSWFQSMSVSRSGLRHYCELETVSAFVSGKFSHKGRSVAQDFSHQEIVRF